MTFVINRSPVGPGEQIEVFDDGSQWGDGDFTIVLAKCDSGQSTPVRTCAQTVQQFEKRHLAVESHDGIETGNARENLGWLKAGVVTTHREVRGYTCFTQRFNDLAEIRSHVLKNEREADHVRFIAADALKNFFGIRTIRHDGRLVA